VGLFGGLFDAPEWVLRLSPFADVPALTAEGAADGAPLLAVGGLALVAAALAFPALRRRDFPV
jgi:ABC-2 type transport system permease protein